MVLRKAKLFALGTALLLDRTADACSCIALYLTPCEQAQEANVVVLATAVSRDPADGNGGLPLPEVDVGLEYYNPNLDVMYTLDIKTLYQGDVDPQEPLTFTTCGNSACCGIYLEIDQEYIVGLYGDNDDLFGQSCGLFIGSPTDGDKEAFDKCEEDPCNRTCSDNQECVYFEEEYICADTTCDPSPCADNEYCNVEKWDCTQEPCPTIAFCRDACNGECGEGEVCELTDEVACIQQPCPSLPQCVPVEEEGECDIECGEYQNCLLFDQPDFGTYVDDYPLYEGPVGREGDWWYCADFCAPGRCEEGQVCELLPTPCPAFWVPCPLVAACYDQCSEGCEANEECVFYPNEGYVCAIQSCDPNPCAEGETCTIFESFPPIVECTPAEEEDRCEGRCTEFQECLIYTHSDESEEAYCADTCAPGRCDPEGCVLAEVPCDREPCPPVAECTNGCLDCEEGEECVNYPEIGYTCAFQSCDPSPCAEGETCVLQKSYPPVVVCLPDDEECDVTCGEFQECLLFERLEGEDIGGGWLAPSTSSEWYCQDVCAPERCEDGEVCELLATSCPGPDNPCPLVAVCSEAACRDVQCDEGQECYIYPDGDQVCALDPCDPAPCAEGETCAVQESFPPVVVCYPEGGEDDCGGSCTEFQECLVFKGVNGAEEPYCADTCAPGACGDEGCVLEEVLCGFGPCPPVAVCTDGCLDCQENEECVNYPEIGYTCAYQSCDPNPCAEDERCAVQEGFPPVVVCYAVDDDCEGICGEFQTCEIYTHSDGIEEAYCADTCAPGVCGDEESCTLEQVQCVRAPCPPVAQCGPAVYAPPGTEYVGCFRDDGDDRVLRHKYDDPEMTNDLCLAHCKSEGAAYMATQYGRECFCYTTGRIDFDRHNNAEEPHECNYGCKGDETQAQTCGGYWAFSLYKLDWPEQPTDRKEFVGCYRDTRDDRVMTDVLVQDNMTPDVCRKHCYYKDAFFYATQYGEECWCGTMSSISDYNKHGDGICHLPCSGDESIACGGEWAFDLFQIID